MSETNELISEEEDDIGRVCLYHALKLGIMPSWGKKSDIPVIAKLCGWTKDKTVDVVKKTMDRGLITPTIGPETSRN